MKKRFFSIFICLVLTAAVFSMPVKSYAKTYRQQLIDKGFPESYVDALVELHSKYPNWTFEPFITNLDWQEAVDGERSSHSKQVIQKTSTKSEAYYCQCSKCKTSSGYVIREGSSWVAASESAVKHYMDPRNWLNEKYIYQFESIAYNSAHKQSGVEAIVSSTWMKDAYITYNSTSGTSKTYTDSSGNKVKYSEAIMSAAKDSGMSAYYLSSKIVQEVGSTKATTGGSCGTREPFIGMYNYYNIGAYSGAMDGLEWASGYLKASNATTLYSEYDSTKKEGAGETTKVASGQCMCYISSSGDYYKVRLYDEKSGAFTKNGAVGFIKKADLRTTYFTYGRPWTTPYKSIYYGAKYIANGYLKYQFTGYLQKFNVNKDSSSTFSHEYMTNVDGAASEAAITYRAYNDANLVSQSKVFKIPVYKNMPKDKCLVGDSGDSSSESEEENKNQVKDLTLDSRTNETLTYSWTKFSGATKYYIYITNLTKNTHFDKTVTTNSATLKGLTPANEYSVKVKAYTSKGWSDYSSVSIAHALPDKMTTPTVKSVASNSITLNWDAMSGADGYYIYSYNTSKKKYTKLKTINDGKTTSAKITSLKSYTNYKLCISAFVVDEKTNASAKSTLVSAKTKMAKVTLKSLSSPSATKIKATWEEANGSENGYQIYYARDKDFKNVVAKKYITSLSTTSYTGKNFTKGVTYYVKIRAYKTVDGKKKYGSWSNVKSVKSK